MEGDLRSKFARGTQYNRKTSLWRRLQGQPFIAIYEQTQEIQVANVNWNYKTADDVVKLEVWDVVDRGKSRRKRSKLKLTFDDNEDDSEDEGGEGNDHPDSPPSAQSSTTPEQLKSGSHTLGRLDAESVDVLRGAHGVIFMFDMTKRWTWDYVVRELPKIPKRYFVLICANFRDMGQHRVVSELEIEQFIQEVESESTEGPRSCTLLETSMRNGYGLKSVAAFFDLPFLNLQRQNILAQLERNERDIKAVGEEIKLISRENSYESYLEMLQHRKQVHRKKDGTSASSPSSDSSPKARDNTATTTSTPPPRTGAAAAKEKQEQGRMLEVDKEKKDEGVAGGTEAVSQLPVKNTTSSKAPEATRPTRNVAADASPLRPRDKVETKYENQRIPASPQEKKKQKGSFFGIGRDRKQSEKANKPVVPPIDPKKRAEEDKKAIEELKKLSKAEGKQKKTQPNPEVIDNFRPDGGMEDDFLGAAGDDGWQVEDGGGGEEESDEEDRGNPLVMMTEEEDWPI